MPRRAYCLVAESPLPPLPSLDDEQNCLSPSLGARSPSPVLFRARARSFSSDPIHGVTPSPSELEDRELPQQPPPRKSKRQRIACSAPAALVTPPAPDPLLAPDAAFEAETPQLPLAHSELVQQLNKALADVVHTADWERDLALSTWQHSQHKIHGTPAEREEALLALAEARQADLRRRVLGSLRASLRVVLAERVLLLPAQALANRSAVDRLTQMNLNHAAALEAEMECAQLPPLVFEP